MLDIKDKYNLQKPMENIANMINIIDDFFINENYKKKGFLRVLQRNIKNKCEKELSVKRIADMLVVYHKKKYKMNDFEKTIDQINKKINKEFIYQSGGKEQDNEGVPKKKENMYTKTLIALDMLFDIVNLIPNSLLTKNYNYIAAPYGILSLIINLLRDDYDFAFYSLLGIIPGIGGVIASSMKIIHRIIRYVINKRNNDKVENYYKEIQTSREVQKILGNVEFVDKLKRHEVDPLQKGATNPFMGNFYDDYEKN